MKSGVPATTVDGQGPASGRGGWGVVHGVTVSAGKSIGTAVGHARRWASPSHLILSVVTTHLARHASPRRRTAP